MPRDTSPQRGTVDVLSARVDFWWSNPTTGVTRTLSTLIGSVYVDVSESSAFARRHGV